MVKSTVFYRKRIDVLSRQLSHYRSLQRWSLKLLEELETDGVKNETYHNFRHAIEKTGADIQGPGHPHIVNGVRAPKKPRPKTSGERHKFPTKNEIDKEVARLSKNLIPFDERNQWEIL